MARTLITDVQVKSGTRKDGKGTYTRYTVRDGNGDFASTFKDDLGMFLQKQVGQFVDLETHKGEKGTDILSVREWREPAPAPGGDGGAGGGDRNRSIQRQVALKAAVQLAVSGGPSVPDVLTLADHLARWLAEDEPAEDEGPPPAFDPDDVA